MISLILLVLAFVLSLVAAFWYPPPAPRPNLGWLALACYFLSLILAQAHLLPR